MGSSGVYLLFLIVAALICVPIWKGIREATRKVVPPPKGQQILVKIYEGNQEEATREFQADAVTMVAQGYRPTAQTWAPGSYGCGAFIGALLLCLVLIGIVIFIYMLLVKPAGRLTVTYELRQEVAAPIAAKAEDEKTCPRCAERVKAAARVCRFCGNEFA